MYALRSRKWIFVAVGTLLAFLAVLLICKGLQPKRAEMPEGVLQSEAAENWTKLFERTEGWLGADGIFSIPLSGVDALSSVTDEAKTLFVFSDTWIGTADPADHFILTKRFVNHSMALLEGGQPDPGKIRFVYGTKGDGSATNLLGYSTWLQDGIAIGNDLYLTGIRTDADWKPTAVDWIHMPILPNGEPDFANPDVAFKAPLTVKDETHQVVFGVGIFDNSKQAKAPKPDGYVYVYGYRDRLADGLKGLVVSRVKRGDLSDFDAWEFWNGKRWVKDIRETNRPEAELASRVSAELSVTPITEGVYAGKYMLVYTKDVMSPYVNYAIADRPAGPFSEGVTFYTCPEDGGLQWDVYCYNAKAHPHLSPPGKLLVTYNVNLRAGEPLTTDVYRPRWVLLDLHKLQARPMTDDSGNAEISEGGGLGNGERLSGF